MLGAPTKRRRRRRGGGGTEERRTSQKGKRYSRKARFSKQRDNTTARRRANNNKTTKGIRGREVIHVPRGGCGGGAFPRENVYARRCEDPAELTGDMNQFIRSDGEVGNDDDDDASKHHHQKAIVHGALLVSMFPALVGSAFRSKYLSQTAKFRGSAAIARGQRR